MTLVIQLPEVDDIETLDGAALDDALLSLERALRQVEGAMVAVVERAERTGAHLLDGFRNITSWSKAVTNTSHTLAAQRSRMARASRDLPEVAAALRRGDVGIAQVALLAQLHANPRCRHQLPNSEQMLLGHARRLSYRQFFLACEHWQRLADSDGAAESADDAHEGRDAKLDLVGDEVVLSANGDTLAGIEMSKIFERFCDTEFLRDWEAARARLGDRAAIRPEDLGRTHAQRRFDALRAIFLQAAGSDQALVSEPLVTLVCDADTYLHHLRLFLGEELEPLDPSTADRRRCETSQGVPVDPRLVVLASMVGKVRRAIVDRSGRVTDLGRRQRLFTGAAREAVFIAEHTCFWPGCERPAERCQVDHVDSWAGKHGVTAPSNGGLGCGPHNRFKERGYRTWRDPDGEWHVYRPDGTEVAPRAPDPPALPPGSQRRAS